MNGGCKCVNRPSELIAMMRNLIISIVTLQNLQLLLLCYLSFHYYSYHTTIATTLLYATALIYNIQPPIHPTHTVFIYTQEKYSLMMDSEYDSGKLHAPLPFHLDYRLILILHHMYSSPPTSYHITCHSQPPFLITRYRRVEL